MSKTTFTRLIAAVVVFQALGVISQENPPSRGRIGWLVQDALRKGKARVDLVPPEIAYRGAASGLEDALTHFAVIRCRVLGQKASSDGNHIQTWYRLQILEALSQPDQQTLIPFHQPRPPAALKRNANEVLLAIPGGALNISGVQIVQSRGDFPELVSGKTYLLFVDLDQTGIGFIGGGPNGLFEIDHAGSMTSAAKGKHPIARDLEAKFGNSFSRFQQLLKANKK